MWQCDTGNTDPDENTNVLIIFISFCVSFILGNLSINSLVYEYIKNWSLI